jgi:hypothetical protein
MTNEQALALYTAMEAEFGELPNFEHYPHQFIFYYRLFKYIKFHSGTNF